MISPTEITIAFEELELVTEYGPGLYSGEMDVSVHPDWEGDIVAIRTTSWNSKEQIPIEGEAFQAFARALEEVYGAVIAEAVQEHKDDRAAARGDYLYDQWKHSCE